MQKKSYSWGLIILMFVLFWPISVWMLVQKLKQETHRFIENGKSMRNLAVLWFVMGIIYLILGLSGEWKNDDGTPAYAASLVMVFVMCVLGILCMKKSKQLTHRGLRYSYFLSQFARQEYIDINQIAADLNLTYEEVVKDLQGMIDTNYIHSAYVDHVQHRLVAKKEVRPTVDIICPHCCGKNRIEIGTDTKCIYCDSPIRR